ncbi:Uncharacterised protein [Mycobacteroides abscessus subsp. abscessus]|nr:Uncharacterised protein [Mycobacteroides abscessus subsp. abscessus]
MRVHHVIGLKPIGCLRTQGGNRLCDEFHRQTVEVRSLPIAVHVKLIERFGRNTGSHDAQYHPADRIGHIQLARVACVGHDHAGTKHRDRQPEHIVRFSEEHLGRPLTIGIAVGVTGVEYAAGADIANVGDFGEL